MRRQVSSLLLVFAVVLSYFQFSHGLAIIGIDFGTNFVKVGIVQPGKSFEIVLNEASKRKTENLIAFNVLKTDGTDESELASIERLYSSDGSGMLVKNPEAVFNDLVSLVSNSEQDIAKSYASKFDVEFSESGVLTLKYDKLEALTVQEVMGNIIDRLKELSEIFASEGEPDITSILDCVITVPSFFSRYQRQIILDAAEIAGLNVLSLINENSGAAINYAVYKSLDEGKKETILFYNMGYQHTQLSIVEYSLRNNSLLNKNSYLKKTGNDFIPVANVIAHHEIMNFGGSNFDEFIKNMLLEEFEDKHPELKGKLDVRNEMRLLKQATKTKEILSANEQIPVVVEALVGEQDLRSSFTREKLNSFKHGERSIEEVVAGAVNELLKKAKLEKEAITAVELLGGGVRMPIIKSTVDAVFKDLPNIEVGQHLNGDEAMALGAVFFAANISKTFRVKRMEFSEISQGAYSVSLQDIKSFEIGADSDDAWKKETGLFDAESFLGTTKAVSFSYDSDFLVHVYQDQENEGEMKQRVVNAYSLRTLGALVEKFGKQYKKLDEESQKPKISLTFSLTSSSIVELSKAEATFTQEYEYKKPSKKKKDNESDTNATESDDTAEEEDEVEIREKKHKFNLDFEIVPEELDGSVLTRDEIKSAIKRLAQFKTIEGKRKEHEFEKNNLEALIFSARDRIRSHDDLGKVTTEDELESFFNFLEEVEDWLYEEEAKSCAVSVILDKKKEINKRVKMIISKYNEFAMRPELLEKTTEFIQKAKDTIERFKVQRSWVDEKKIASFSEAVSAFETYFEEVVKQQKSLTDMEDPVLVAREVAKRIEPVQFLFEQIVKAKKPKAPKPETETAEVTKAEETEQTEEQPEDAEEEEEDNAAEESKEKDEL